MSDNLDQLSDAALSEVFAVEVAGFLPMDHMLWDVGACRLPFCRERSDGRWIATGNLPFATSADAVLPCMRDIQWTARNGHDYCDEMHRVTILRNGSGHIIAEAFAPTFARAACIALIRAKRAEKGGRP